MNLRQFRRILQLVLVVPLAAMLGMAAAIFWQMTTAHETVTLMQAAGGDIAKAIQVQRLIGDEESALRGFQITSDPAFLQPYLDAQPQIEQSLKALEANANLAITPTPALTAERRTRIAAVRSAQALWRQSFAEPLIDTIKAGGHTDDRELNLLGRNQMETLRDAVAVLVTSGQRRAHARSERFHTQQRQTFLVLGSLALAAGLILGLFMRRLLRQVTDAYRQNLNVLHIRVDETFRSEEKLRTTLASIGDGVITCDLEGRIESMNRVAQHLTGWDEVEARKHPLEGVLHLVSESEREPAPSILELVRVREEIVRLPGHSILVRKDLTETMIDESGAPIRDQSGKLIGFVLVLRDVTMARKSQAALIANEKLAVSGRLAATIAHEIHNPLDSVSNLLFLMDGVATPEESAQFLSLAKQEIARVTQISRAMLSLYRESRSPVAIDLGEMLESVKLLLERRLSDLNVTLSLNIPAETVIHGFPAELRQVFTNLLTNAAEAAGTQPGTQLDTATGGVAGTIKLNARPIANPAGFEITIRDNGTGIPEEIREHLFEAFITTKGERGTGLGLWVSRGIILRHGGAIDIESHTSPDHHGTTVRVFLAQDPIIQPAPPLPESIPL